MRTTRRRWLLSPLLLAAVAAGVVMLWPAPPPRPCLATFRQVRDGMSFDEVVATVGGPPDECTLDQTPDRPPPDYLARRMEWRAKDGNMTVDFDGRDRVMAVWVGEYAPLPTWGQLVRRRLGI